MKLKRISIILLVLIYAFACIPVSGHNATNAVNTSYEEMLGTLVALDIIGEEEVAEFTPETNVTRAQIVVMAMRLLKTNTVGLSEEFDSFYDVPPEHEAYNEILMAHKLGIISGVNNEKFDPQGTVSYEQAVKILVSTLGYEQAAQQKGGYPEGYLSVAMRADLLDGVTVENKEALTHKSVVQMVYNALETDMFDATYYLSGGDYVEQIQEGVTLLEDRLNIKTVRGTVKRNEITGVDTVVTVSEGQVMINGEVYFVGDTAIADYLGYNVKAYYTDEPIKKIIYFSHTQKYNNVIALSGNDDLEISYDGTKFTFSYTDKNGNRREETSSGSCIYNGIYTDKIQTADPADVDVMTDITGKSLSVKLIDNNLDNSYEVIILDSYEAFLVNNVSSVNERLRYYTFGADRSMNLTEINISVDNDIEYSVYDADGKRVGLDAIEAKNIVSISRDLSGKRYTLRVSNKKITGEILEMSDDGEYTIRVEDDSIVTSEGDKVTFDAVYKKSNSFPGELLYLGLYTTFYLDTEGNIAALEMASSLNGSYGLILGYGEGSKGINSYPQFKILTSDGTTLILEAEKKITAYNPNTNKVEKTEVSRLVDTAANVSAANQKYYLWLTENQSNFDAESGATDNTKPFYYRPWLSDKEKSDIASRKMVYYKTNKDGRITTILVPDIPDTKHNKLTLMNTAGRYGYTYVSGAYLVYDPSAGDESITGGNDYIKIAEDATVFSGIALDYSEDNFNVRDVKILNATTTKMWMYSVEGSAEARIILRYTPLPREWTSSLTMVVVKSVSPQKDGSYQLKGYSKGAEYSDTILPNTRLVERQLSSSNSSYVPVKQTEIKNYVATACGGVGDYCYDYSTFAGATHQYADNESIKRGDILLVGKDYRTGICYVEVAMRAENCVQLYPSTQSSFVGRLKSKSIQKGVVVGYTNTGEILVNTVGQYHKNAARTTTPPANYKLVENGKVGSFYYDRKMPYNFTACKSVWIYDYSSKTMEVATYSDIMIGDILMVTGSALAPLDCIILRNNPNEPSFDYWNETPVIPDGGDADEPGSGGGTTITYPITLIDETFDSYTEGTNINNGITWGTGLGEFKAATVNGSVAMLFPTGVKNLNTYVDFTNVVLGDTAGETTETVVEFDLYNVKGINIELRSGSKAVSTVTTGGGDLKIDGQDSNLNVANEVVTHIKIVIDEKAKTLDLYLNGSDSATLENVAMPDVNNMNAINRLMFKTNGTSQSGSIDNIKIVRREK